MSPSRWVLIGVAVGVLVASVVLAVRGSAALWATAVAMVILLVSQAQQIRAARRQAARMAAVCPDAEGPPAERS